MKFFLVVFLLFVLPLNAYAHRPIDTSNAATREDPIVIEDHKISWAAYNKLTNVNDVDYYRLTSVKKGESIFASMLVPKIERLKSFDPVIAVIGPGLGKETDDIKEETIKNLLVIDKGEGFIIKKNDNKDESFFEPFTQTSYWKKQELEVVAPVAGTYYITVFTISNNADKYVLSIGKLEKWGIKDLAKMPGIWWRVRMFVEKRISTYLITGIIFLLFLSLIYLITKKFIFSKF